MRVIGLTGPSGAGKGSAAALLSSYDIPHINCDEIYHSLLFAGSDCTNELAERFGKDIIDSDGAVDRKKLSAVVFSKDGREKALGDLNRITHKYVLSECRRLIEKYNAMGKKAVCIDAPTLIESGFHKECNIILVINAERAARLRRIIMRDGISLEKAMDRLNSQPPDSFYTEKADFVINNSGDLNDLKKQIEDFIWEKLN